MFLAMCRVCGWECRSDEIAKLAVDHSVEEKHAVDIFSLAGTLYPSLVKWECVIEMRR